MSTAILCVVVCDFNIMSKAGICGTCLGCHEPTFGGFCSSLEKCKPTWLGPEELRQVLSSIHTHTHTHTHKYIYRTPFIFTHYSSNPPVCSRFSKLQTYILHTSWRMHPPVLVEQNCQKSLQSLLMPSILPTPPDTNPCCFRCNKWLCIICTSHLVETSTFSSSTTKEAFQICHSYAKVLTLCTFSTGIPVNNHNM